MDDDIPYLLLTPGPLTTSRTVRQSMMTDYSTWDVDYNTVVNQIRRTIVELATNQPDYTCTLMQGSGTFAVESRSIQKLIRRETAYSVEPVTAPGKQSS